MEESSEIEETSETHEEIQEETHEEIQEETHEEIQEETAKKPAIPKIVNITLEEARKQAYQKMFGKPMPDVEKSVVWMKGPKGDPGEQGPQGEIGPEGPTGDIGPRGECNCITYPSEDGFYILSIQDGIPTWHLVEDDEL